MNAVTTSETGRGEAMMFGGATMQYVRHSRPRPSDEGTRHESRVSDYRQRVHSPRPRPPVRVRAVALRVLGVLVVLIAGFTVAHPPTAEAHPLGNFTVNRYARLEPGTDTMRIIYALDMAEIPTFQEMSTLDRDRNGTISDEERLAYLAQRLPELARNLKLTVGDTALPVRVDPGSGRLTLADGQGGLQVLRIDAVFLADLTEGSRGGVVSAWFRDTNYDTRLGWKEIVVRGTSDAAIRDSSVAPDISNELRAYPDSSLENPLEVREARFSFEPGVAGETAATNAAARAAERTNQATGSGILSRFAESAATRNLTLPVVLFLLLAAVFWGALHALGPGHGKTVVAAYLVGSRGTARHAVLLGLTVTATHTAGVYLLGFVTLFASHFIVPERLYPILSLFSGLVVTGMGMSLLIGRLRASGTWPFGRRAHDHPGRTAGADHAHSDGDEQPSGAHDHPHGHDHGAHSHGHGGRAHSHSIPGDDGRPVTWRNLVALGIYGGMIPCPTAIVVLLTSISLNRVAFGLGLVVAFSFGLAVVLVGIGIALVYAGRAMARVKVNRAIVQLVPVLSAAAVITVGVLITLRAMGQTGLPVV